tara:strand:- start:141 stop:845 length:705 start_codon:yes stop_codon:yes gene_type:complete
MKSFFSNISLILVILLISCSQQKGLDRSVLEDSTRPDKEKAQDVARKVLEVYEFFGIQPGMTVADLWPGGGYNMHILSRLMGENGKVFCMMGVQEDRYQLTEVIDARVAKANLTNVEVFYLPSDLPKNSIDVMVAVRNYHDHDTPRDQLLADLRVALKPNGIVGIVEVATNRPGWDEETHRLNEKVVIEEFTSNGFILEASSDMLRNPDDDYSIRGFDEGRYNMDRYLLKFRKN